MTISLFAATVYDKLRDVPAGKVTTYGYLARAAGFAKAARAVGGVMRKNPFAPSVPCHRVVRTDGSIGGFNGGITKKIKLLNNEGVRIRNGKIVDFKRILYKFD